MCRNSMSQNQKNDLLNQRFTQAQSLVEFQGRWAHSFSTKREQNVYIKHMYLAKGLIAWESFWGGHRDRRALPRPFFKEASMAHRSIST